MTNPEWFCAELTARHFKLAGQPMPPWLAGYVNGVLEDGSASGTNLLTVQQVAVILGVSPRAVTKQAPKLSGRKVGRMWLFEPQEVSRIAQHRVAQQGRKRVVRD